MSADVVLASAIRDIRRASDVILLRETPGTPKDADVLLSEWLERTADVLTATMVLEGAGVDLIVMDSGSEALAFARLILSGAKS